MDKVICVDNNGPVVTVVVVSYNSAKYIEETLESISKQTYINLELIVADDCSQDDTLAVVESWLDWNKKRFCRCKIVAAGSNTGLPANCNRGLKEATGEYVKFIAADDLLLPICIEYNARFFERNPECGFVVSRMAALVIDDTRISSDAFRLNQDNVRDTFSSGYITPFFLMRCSIAPAMFYRRASLIAIGGFDDRFRLIEDSPLWLKIYKAGLGIGYFDEETVAYRIHNSSISAETCKRAFNPRFVKELTIVYYTRGRKYCTVREKLILDIDIFLKQITVRWCNRLWFYHVLRSGIFLPLVAVKRLIELFGRKTGI